MTLSKTPESSQRSSELLQSQQETKRELPKFCLQSSKSRMLGEGPEGERGLSWKPEVAEEVPSGSGETKWNGLLLLHSSLFCSALRGGALVLFLSLPVPWSLLEHKPTVSGPQEEVDETEELQKHNGNIVRIATGHAWK